ncbi:HlyD family type I secretion periplasmic adaptor subunit [Rhodoferax sp.]|uniref:HlyD family type I secretion periplasmic adaptor subunit n=1 Tax=Rhodoferax sp. TaxID=50421 RepID=UPI0026348D31|nr:HlyD family type I secretion periplasmic adaptor subunit [Rhodoferax sp.]MDD5478452.1 HlyD family type I secretion periplasmic adaptor subunit [Rhodoferax sp.]
MAIKDTFNTAAPDAAHDTQKLTAHTGRSARIGLWALGLGFGGFLLWAGLAPLDEGVPSQGMISIDTKRKTVQHLTGGLVKEILVGEGELVKEGQLLVRLDEAVARANFEAARQRYVGLRAMESRLQAEQRGLKKISFHPDVIQAANDPQIREVLFTQEQLFNSRSAALQADLQSTQESIQGQQGLIQAYESMLANRKSQQALLAEELANTRSLVKEGYAPRNRQLELERMNAESSASIAELMGNTIRAKRAVAELQQRAIARQQEYRKEVETQLADVGRELPGDAEKLRAAKDDFSRIDIKSPATGQVVGLAFQTVGGVIGPGQKLMDIVPQDQALLIEARVAPHLIDRVNNGMLVDVRFSSFAHTPQLVVQGKVVSVSGDVLVDPQTGVGYYLARVGVTAEGYKQLGKRQLQPGMPVEVVFLTGERSMLTYLLSPLTKRLAASMKEE